MLFWQFACISISKQNPRPGLRNNPSSSSRPSESCRVEQPQSAFGCFTSCRWKNHPIYPQKDLSTQTTNRHRNTHGIIDTCAKDRSKAHTEPLFLSLSFQLRLSLWLSFSLYLCLSLSLFLPPPLSNSFSHSTFPKAPSFLHYSIYQSNLTSCCKNMQHGTKSTLNPLLNILK